MHVTLITKSGTLTDANQSAVLRAFREISEMGESITVESDRGRLRVTGPVGDEHLVQLFAPGAKKHISNEMPSEDVEQALLGFMSGGRVGVSDMNQEMSLYGKVVALVLSFFR